MNEELKVGELANRSGVSVRTLHYYEEVGLLVPAARTAAGHRLFGHQEVMRLQQIRSLVQLGFSLDEVKGFLGDPDFSALGVVEMHIERLDQVMVRQTRLRSRLASIAQRLAAASEIEANDFLQVIKETTMFDKYYTPEQLETLETRREEMGPEAMEKAQNDWAELIADVQAEMDRGAEPTSEPVLALARRWQALIDAFTQRDPGITQSLGKVWQNEAPQLRENHGRFMPSAEMMGYMSRALGAL